MANAAPLVALDCFTAANRLSRQHPDQQALFEVRLYAINSVAHTSSGLPLPAAPASSIPADATVFLPAPPAGNAAELQSFLERNQGAIAWLADNASRCEFIATHCAGAAVLAQCGLLNGQQATTAWYLADACKHLFPEVKWRTEAMLINSRHCITAGAGSAYNDVLLHLIEHHGGRHNARLVAKFLLLDNQRQQQSPFCILGRMAADDELITAAQAWIQQHIQDDFCVEDIASALGTSQRTLLRRMRDAIGESPVTLTQKMRIEKSKILLESTSLPLSSIVYRVGYSDESAFRRVFMRLVQVTPKEYRRRFHSVSRKAFSETD